MNLPTGKYIGVATAASVYKSKGGALMVALSFDITSPGFEAESITAHECLGQKNGDISAITVETFKQCFGWGGADPFQIVDDAASGALRERPVELVIEQESFTGSDGTQKSGARVKFINPIGGKLPESADRNSIMAEYGAKLRALGGQAAKPTTPKAPSAPAPAPLPLPTKGCTKDAAWHTACTAKHGFSDAELNTDWFDLLARLFPGQTENSLTPYDWAKVKEHYSDDVPY